MIKQTIGMTIKREPIKMSDSIIAAEMAIIESVKVVAAIPIIASTANSC